MLLAPVLLFGFTPSLLPAGSPRRVWPPTVLARCQFPSVGFAPCTAPATSSLPPPPTPLAPWARGPCRNCADPAQATR
ncbi:MAG: hypothetical protein J3K34DRAFT_417117 [Monoraphidium minutum]|nr:MAG: hypothetical protein J3K34DRAFT_417117 [Monoraphidium minutum]